ncbi:MAG TPA: malto-oligosyltrehalose trehalohydrolase [Bryobacteraceae bacterium]|nr:malto-oligosyltrehalose trehalohydrolase [Bryobacteraceae bacterium]
MPRRYPIGAEVGPEGVHFRVWAPRRKTVEVVLEDGSAGAHLLEREPSGYHAGLISEARAGSRYRFRLDGGDTFPDPASRFQPEGPHGPSQVVDPRQFRWSDSGWRGIPLEGQVIYEMHIGTFTREGTFAAAQRELAELAEIGITVIEVMPVADFPGRFGWGYDGVGLFAPVAIYGGPDDLRRFVDDAHRAGIGVILDVVYNHVGPDGNYLRHFWEDYFTSRYENEWGEAINYDGENSCGVREWVVTNAAYWIDEFHLDGLRLDATQTIYDSSQEHIIAALTKAARHAAQGRQIIVVAENERQETRLARTPETGGYGIDALWNDDFHHSARVALTGRNEAYYSGYLGKPQELLSAIKYGYLYQGQRYQWQKKRRGTPALDLAPAQFVLYLENHDQISNSGRGERVCQLTSAGQWRAMTALLLLAPGTPMLFQGQEFGSSSPFHFFADHNAELSKLVRDGRIQFLSQFQSLAQPEMTEYHVDPSDAANFERCKLDFEERQRHAPIYSLYRDLLKLRREDPVFRRQKQGAIDGAVLSAEALLVRYFSSNGEDRLLLINLGGDLHLDPAPEPLLAPPRDCVWELLWSSENPRYGGGGTPRLDSEGNWRIPGHAAVAMRPVPEPSHG